MQRQEHLRIDRRVPQLVRIEGPPAPVRGLRRLVEDDADIFFSLYLREVVEQERGVALADAIIPEVPIKHPHGNQSVKTDYLLASTDRERAFLVELKADPLSRRGEQDLYLAEAAAAGIESDFRRINSE